MLTDVAIGVLAMSSRSGIGQRGSRRDGDVVVGGSGGSGGGSGGTTCGGGGGGGSGGGGGGIGGGAYPRIAGVVVHAGAEMRTIRDIDPGDPANILLLYAFEYTQACPQSICLNDIAPWNISVILITLDTSHFWMSLLNDLAARNIADMPCTFETSHFERSPLNELAPRNMPDISYTFDTSHLEMSPLNKL